MDIQKALSDAGQKAKAKNKSETVVLPDNDYEFETLIIPAHVSLIAENPAARSVRLIYAGAGNQNLIEMGFGGYGSMLQGIEIRSKNNVPNLTALKINNAINPTVRNVRIDLRGQNNTGLEIKGRESICIEKFESRCTSPVIYYWGDNVVFRDCDLGQMKDTSIAAFEACVEFRGMPHQVSFEGTQTWQGGKYAIYGAVDVPASGQCVNISNLRYEQSTSADNSGIPAIKFIFIDRHLECFNMFGCRWSQRKNAIEISNVIKTNFYGCFLPGTKDIA